MNERDTILGRIREALTAPAAFPGSGHQSALAAPIATHSASQARQWLPVVGKSSDERLALFRKNAAELKAEFHLVANREALAKLLVELRDRDAWTKIGTHAGELTDFCASSLRLPVYRTEKGYQVSDLESCSAGVTECDALIAQTGSILLTSRSAGGRALSVLPPHHVVLARLEQLIADLPDAFALLKRKYAPNYPSFTSFITGPSRTGDIERILVLGAHGPKKLTICCLQELQ